jgi:EmrB/QacA subfamily drug resistance transporter
MGASRVRGHGDRALAVAAGGAGGNAGVATDDGSAGAGLAAERSSWTQATVAETFADSASESAAGSAASARIMTTGHPIRTFIVVAAAMFMAQLDNLVVTSALPSIQKSLHAGLQGLQWTVSAYTLTFAVFLLTGSTLGDRFGRKRLFTLGLSLFTLASVASALAPNIGSLIAARAVQGLGGAIVVPLTLTLLSAAVRPERRGLAIGGWGALAGLAIALGPVIGGGVVEAASWQWIFWLNVPIGLVLVPVSRFWLTESRGPARRLDLAGTVLASLGLFGVVLGLIRGGSIGWTNPQVLGSFIGGAAFLAAFIVQELRSDHPMLPLTLFRSRAFSLVNVASLLMFFGMFGSVFFLIQLFQGVWGYSPLAAGVRMLPWTALPMVIAPIAGGLSDRIGGRAIVGTGLLIQAVALGWLAAVITPHVPYSHLIPGLVLGGIGNGMFFAPIANLLFGSVRREQEGIASGVNNALRELGGVFGIAVMGAIFSAHGGYGPTRTLSPAQHFINGLTPAVWTGAALLTVASLAMWLMPRAQKKVYVAAAAEA